MSYPEQYISNLLQRAGVRYIREYTFSDLKHGRLRYDFYLPQQNLLIEYDGEQHFQQVSKFQRKQSDFQHYAENDRIKNSYALARKIPLYRIPFWELSKIFIFNDILQPKYLVTSKWHNDQIYRDYLKSLD